MRTAAWCLILAVLVVSALVAIRHDPDDFDPPSVVHVVDQRGDVEWSPPTTTSTSTTTVTPAPTTTVAPRARTAPTRQVARPMGAVVDIIRRGFARFGPAVAEQAVRVAGCETGRTYNPRARNGQHLGLFQISRTYHEARARRLGFAWEQMAEPAPNVAVAADIYAESGWQPWTCRWAA